MKVMFIYFVESPASGSNRDLEAVTARWKIRWTPLALRGPEAPQVLRNPNATTSIKGTLPIGGPLGKERLAIMKNTSVRQGGRGASAAGVSLRGIRSRDLPSLETLHISARFC
jgi:hypothetical protein